MLPSVVSPNTASDDRAVMGSSSTWSAHLDLFLANLRFAPSQTQWWWRPSARSAPCTNSWRSGEGGSDRWSWWITSSRLARRTKGARGRKAYIASCWRAPWPAWPSWRWARTAWNLCVCVRRTARARRCVRSATGMWRRLRATTAAAAAPAAVAASMATLTAGAKQVSARHIVLE